MSCLYCKLKQRKVEDEWENNKLVVIKHQGFTGERGEGGVLICPTQLIPPFQKAFTLSLKSAVEQNRIVWKDLHKHQEWTCGCRRCTAHNTIIRTGRGRDTRNFRGINKMMKEKKNTVEMWELYSRSWRLVWSEHRQNTLGWFVEVSHLISFLFYLPFILSTLFRVESNRVKTQHTVQSNGHYCLALI